MKRTNAATDPKLIEEARLRKMRSIVEFFGKGLWKGDLAEMRPDRPRRRAPRSPAKLS